LSGIFTKLGGQDRAGLGAINVSSGQLTPWNPNPSNAHPEYSYNLVQALTLSGNTLYVGGSFSSIANQSRSYIASFDASTGNLTNWNPQVSFGYVNESPSIMSMAVDGNGKLYVGGSFGDDNHSSFYNLFILDQNGTEYYWPIDMEASADNGYYAPALANVAISGHYMYASSYNDFARYDLNSPVPMTSLFNRPGGMPRASFASRRISATASASWRCLRRHRAISDTNPSSCFFFSGSFVTVERSNGSFFAMLSIPLKIVALTMRAVKEISEWWWRSVD
jgi:hypothetical protein